MSTKTPVQDAARDDATIADVRAGLARAEWKINALRGTLEEREERIKGLLRRLETQEAAEDEAARLAELRIAELLEERDAAIERNAALKRRLAAEEERRRELETLIDGARNVLFQAAKRAQQTVEK